MSDEERRRKNRERCRRYWAAHPEKAAERYYKRNGVPLDIVPPDLFQVTVMLIRLKRGIREKKKLMR